VLGRERPSQILMALVDTASAPFGSTVRRLAIQRVLNTTLDQSRYQVQAIICHEQNCQIFSNPQTPGAESDWPPIVEAIMQELAKASFRSPEAGAGLKPTLKSIARDRRKDAVTVTIIWLR
jgi:hypothetical protein